MQYSYNIYANHNKVVLNLQASNMNASMILHEITTTYIVHRRSDCD